MQMRPRAGWRRFWSAGLLAGALLTACTPAAPGGPTPTPPGPSPTPSPLPTMTPHPPLPQARVKWTAQPGAHLERATVVVGGVMYVAEEDGCICALDAQTGQVRWQVPPPGEALTTPAVGNGMVYVGMFGDWQDAPVSKQTSYLYAFDAQTGAIRWQFHGDSAGSEYASTPVVADGVVYVGTGHADDTGRTPIGGIVSALDATTGQVLWQRPTSGAATGVTVGDGLVFFSDGHDYDYQADHLHAVDARTGQDKWTRTLPADLGTLPLVHDHLLYYGSQGQLIALDTQTGQEQWRRALSADSFAWPVFADGTLYFASTQKRFHCIDNCPRLIYQDYLCAVDATTGQPQWTVTFSSDTEPVSDLAVAGGVLYQTGFRPDYVEVRDARTGQEQWQFDAPDSIFGAPAVAEGVVYVGLADGRLYALQPPGTPPAR